MNNAIKTSKRNLPASTIWNISFGFLGIQMAYGLQSANMSRIFQSLGADPNNLSYFWILPPLAGMVIQPIVGVMSDRTWSNRFGRRMPYLLIGAITAIIVMILLPNSGSLGMSVNAALIFGAIVLLFMDLSSNVAMQPFKMLVGDMVNEEQKSFAYSVQSFLSNTGNVLASVFPFLLTAIGIANIAGDNQVPDSVKFSFYAGAVILLLCTAYSFFNVKEMPPKEYNKFHGITKKEHDTKDKLWTIIKKAPKVFWTVSLVQFFCWMAFLYLWNYGTGAVAENVWGVDTFAANLSENANFQTAGNWFGILSLVQAVGAVLWSLVLTRVPNDKKKPVYSVSLLIGAIGFGSVFFIHNQYALVISFFLIGIAWASMMAYPFILVSNALSGKNIGTYLGIFNCSICLPQIVAAVFGKTIISPLHSQAKMLVVSAVFLLLGSLAVWVIKETFGELDKGQATAS